jgi:hypothetical protein
MNPTIKNPIIFNVISQITINPSQLIYCFDYDCF